jgi:hypothetical protein
VRLPHLARGDDDDACGNESVLSPGSPAPPLTQGGVRRLLINEINANHESKLCVRAGALATRHTRLC